MKLHLLAAGTRMPAWVEAGFNDYAKRMPAECRLTLTEIALGQRGKSADPAKAVAAEGERMLAKLGERDAVIALEVEGQAWSTRQLADRLSAWLGDGRDRALLIGGPDGLSADCRRRSELSWSLSPLTLPHGLARIVVAEQLYRALSLLKGHPYHR